MDNEYNADEQKFPINSPPQESIIKLIYQSICPCLIINPYLINKFGGLSERDRHNLKNTERVSQKLNSIANEKSSEYQKSMISRAFNKDHLYKTVNEHAHRLLQEYDANLDKSTIKKWHSYTIYEYKENEIVTIGTSKGRILAKINTVRVDASANAKKLTNKSKLNDKSDSFAHSSFDKNWNRRYLLFERFDEGISLDDESWDSVTPEAIAEHIASKIRCDTILDGFCGVGGSSIKFSNTCSRVIANDNCLMKLKCLETNSKVYFVDNIEILNENFLDLGNIEPDVVYLSPPYQSEVLMMSNCLDPYEMNPPFNKIFAKSIQLSKNIVILLPPNINIKKLGELIAREYIDSKSPSPTCSIKIEKIFFMSQLRYLAVYIGCIIEKEINLNDELCFIYNYLKEGSKKNFHHKKIIRELRLKYGMISLLNFLFDLDKVEESGSLIEKLYCYIRKNSLIDNDKLEKLIKEESEEIERYSKKRISLVSDIKMMEKEKYMGEDKEETDRERTLSYYSGASASKSLAENYQTINPEKRQTILSNKKDKIMDFEQIPRSNTIEFSPTDFFSQSSRHESEVEEFECYT